MPTATIGNKPTLIIMVGLVGTGKSTLANALSERLGCAVVSSDIIRKEWAGVPPEEHRYEKFNEGIYSPKFSLRVYNRLFSTAFEALMEGSSVILDASFARRVERTQARNLVEELGAGFYAIECRLDESIAKERLANRKDTVSDGRWEIYLKQKEAFEPVVELPPGERIVVDTAKPVGEIVGTVLAKISGGKR